MPWVSNDGGETYNEFQLLPRSPDGQANVIASPRFVSLLVEPGGKERSVGALSKQLTHPRRPRLPASNFGAATPTERTSTSLIKPVAFSTSDGATLLFILSLLLSSSRRTKSISSRTLAVRSLAFGAHELTADDDSQTVMNPSNTVPRVLPTSAPATRESPSRPLLLDSTDDAPSFAATMPTISVRF